MDIMSVGIFAGMIILFYFLMIRPENKKKQAATEMRNSLSVGDRIITVGGLVGKVVGIDEDLITFETSEDRVRIQVVRSAISVGDDSIAKAESK